MEACPKWLPFCGKHLWCVVKAHIIIFYYYINIRLIWLWLYHEFLVWFCFQVGITAIGAIDCPKHWIMNLNSVEQEQHDNWETNLVSLGAQKCLYLQDMLQVIIYATVIISMKLKFASKFVIDWLCDNVNAMISVVLKTWNCMNVMIFSFIFFSGHLIHQRSDLELQWNNACTNQQMNPGQNYLQLWH